MSNFQAIGGVSATLKALLEDRMELPPGITVIPVTISTPGPEPQDGQTVEEPRVNLFLYQVTENTYLKNQEIPGQGHPGAYGHPPLSLDLHYLLTAYGTTSDEDFVDETRAHYLLGSAMRVLHDHPIVTELLTTIRPPVGQPILDQSLRGEFEQVKLCLEPISLEDLSKVWTALTLPYRLSAAYLVTVVQIESEQPRLFPRLVGEPPAAGPRVYVLPFQSPQISEIRVRRPGDSPDVERPFPYARIGDTLILRGRNFDSEATRVTLGAVDATAGITVLQDDRIEVTIPDDVGLQPGPQPARVLLDVMMGEPPQPHAGFQSNLAVFVLVPRIDTLTPNLGVTPRTLRINGAWLFQADLECLTLVGDEVIHSNGYTTATSTEILFNLPDTLGSGNYAVRVRVNGAESIDLAMLNIP